MSKIKLFKITDILWSMLLGMLSFFISGVIACILILRFDFYILETIVAGGIGGFLIGLFLRMRQKIGILTIAGLVAVPIGFWASFVLAEALFSIPFIQAFFENPNTPDIVGITLMGILYGAVFGAILYGRKSIWLFAVACGVSSFPFGFLVAALNSGHQVKAWLENLLYAFGKIDLNLLSIIVSFGIGTGLSIGIYNLFNLKHADG